MWGGGGEVDGVTDVELEGLKRDLDGHASCNHKAIFVALMAHKVLSRT